MKKYLRISFVLTSVIGVSMIVYGGYDDSPGAQLLGLILMVAGVLHVRKHKKTSQTDDN